MLQGPFPSRDSLYHEAHQREPDQRPELGGAGPNSTFLLAGRDHRRQPLPELTDLGLALLVQQPRLGPLQEHAHQRRVLRRSLHHSPPYALQPLAGRDTAIAFLGLQQADPPLVGLAIGLVEERLFPREMPIDGGLGDAGALGQLRRGGDAVAGGGEQLQRRAHQLGPGGEGVPAPGRLG